MKAIADPRRRDILRLVRRNEVSAGDIARHFDVSRPAISQHLTVLKNAGLLAERRDGTRRFYRARPEGLEELRSYLDGFWDATLLDLKRVAEAAEETNTRRKRIRAS
jgi:DNA-binding transcriptional ArsR family regulator